MVISVLTKRLDKVTRLRDQALKDKYLHKAVQGNHLIHWINSEIAKKTKPGYAKP